MPTYIIRAGETEMVKIGWAVQVEKRRGYLQVGCWEVLRTIRVITGPRAVEGWMRRKFADLRVLGEWHRFHPDMLSITVPTLAIPPRPIGDPLLDEIERFLHVTGMSATQFGRQVLADPGLVHSIRTGRECRRATTRAITQFIETETAKRFEAAATAERAA